MDKFTPEEREDRKRAIFDAMSPRRQKHILKRGYERWDPFIEPKDPIEIRQDKTRRTSAELFRQFMYQRDSDKYSNAYGQGVLEMAIGLVNADDRFIAMFEFASWYRDLLEREGVHPNWD